MLSDPLIFLLLSYSVLLIPVFLSGWLAPSGLVSVELLKDRLRPHFLWGLTFCQVFILHEYVIG
jgi:hypothetical protein